MFPWDLGSEGVVVVVAEEEDALYEDHGDDSRDDPVTTEHDEEWESVGDDVEMMARTEVVRRVGHGDPSAFAGGRDNVVVGAQHGDGGSADREGRGCDGVDMVEAREGDTDRGGVEVDSGHIAVDEEVGVASLSFVGGTVILDALGWRFQEYRWDPLVVSLTVV